MSDTYFSKVAEPTAWLRLLSGKSSYRVIWRVIRDRLRPRKGEAAGEAPAPKAEVDNTNPRFASAFMAMLETGRPMLLLFSGADRLRAQFAENFEAHHGARLQPVRHLCEVHVIPDANHVLSDPAWVEELASGAEKWLAGRYPGPAGGITSPAT